MAIVTVDAKGRLAIPSEVRAALGIEAGDVLFLESDAEEQVLHLAKAINPFDGLAEYAVREYHAGRTRSLRAFAEEEGIDLDGAN